MINFRWGQAASQASGFTQAISAERRKDEGLEEGSRKAGSPCEGDSVAPLTNALPPFFRSSNTLPSLPPPINLAEWSG